MEDFKGCMYLMQRFSAINLSSSDCFAEDKSYINDLGSILGISSIVLSYL